jgi:ADP-heptose:LPS heptosyltransferase
MLTRRQGKHYAVKRFRGEELGAARRVALISSDALGNYIAVTPLLQMLRVRFPNASIHYFGGSRTKELWQLEPAIEKGYELLGRPPRDLAGLAVQQDPFDLVINLERSQWAVSFAALLCCSETYVIGPVLDLEGRGLLPFPEDERGRLWSDHEWTSPDLPARYPFLKSGFIGEIFCRLCYLDGPIPPYRIVSHHPVGVVPEALISTVASLSSKLWPLEKWNCVLEELKGRMNGVGVIGASRPQQARYWLGGQTEDALIREFDLVDLRGKFSLPGVAGAIARAKQVVTIDNGVLHLAASVGTPTVGLFRPGIHRLWAPPVSSIRVLRPEESRPVAEIPVSQVVSALAG